MRPLEPSLTPELAKHVEAMPVWRAPAFSVKSYRELVEHVARLSYANPNQLLFFRGQDRDFQSKAGGSTLYPAIYRGDNVPRRELEYRFEQLDAAARILSTRFTKASVEGHRDVARKRYIQWSILQHYEVVPTPLLDLTHSLRVACSFAQYGSTDPTCYVYVIGLPYTSNRIALNSEEDIVNIRLLSICPPAALRPYFQEGYMAGTPDVSFDFESKTELDFRNRLVAKFAIPRAKVRFWRGGFAAIPQEALYPPGDRIQELCAKIGAEVEQSQRPPGTLGDFIVEWSHLEHRLVERARQLTERNVSVREAINALARHDQLSEELVHELNILRHFRNTAVHSPAEVESRDFGEVIQRLREVQRRLGQSIGGLSPHAQLAPKAATVKRVASGRLLPRPPAKDVPHDS
jgi:hypothetical protein